LIAEQPQSSDPYTLEAALKTNEINSIYKNTYPYIGLFNNTMKSNAGDKPTIAPTTIVPPLQLKKGLTQDRTSMVPTPDQGF
jgi:hypothetical protein